MSLKLTARGASGALYRLRQGSFQVEQIADGGPTFPEPGFPVDPIPEDPAPTPRPRPGPMVPPIIIAPDGGTGGVGTGGFAGSVGTAGSATMGGAAGGGGFAGSGSGGSGAGFFTFLFTEDDPLATTLETNLPTGQYLITLFDGWFLERVLGGEVTVVDARLVSPQTTDFFISANEETFVSYRFETNGDVVEFGDGRLIVDIEVDENGGGGGGEDPRFGAMENAIEALPFTLEETLGTALSNAGSGLSGLSAYHAIIDSYATTAEGRDPNAVHCDDQLVDGQATLNGFPLDCPRLEAQQFDNIGSWFPTAAVSRLDLAPADGANCGQQRLIFANNTFIGNGRMFIIIEAEVPNPSPECGVAACAPIAAFWASLAEIQDPAERGARLREAFLTGSPELAALGFTPFMNATHLGVDGGQIRTNNFNHFIWTLREFHFQDVERAPVPVPVAESPNGALWNDLAPSPQGEACREDFLRAAEFGLLTDNLNTMSFPVDEACKDAESRNDGSQDYSSSMSLGSGAFAAELDALGAPFGLTASQIANRARFAGSCMGCHIEASFSDLGNGLFAPPQSDFVQVNEFILEDCGNGGTCFGVSEALRTVFLPHRQRVAQALLENGSCGAVPPPPPVDPPQMNPLPLPPRPGSTPVPPGTTPPSPPDMGTAPPPSEGVEYSIGGQLVGEHAH